MRLLPLTKNMHILRLLMGKLWRERHEYLTSRCLRSLPPMIYVRSKLRRCNCDACTKCSGLVVPSSHPAKISPGSLNCGGGHGLALFSVTTRTQCDWCRRDVDAGNVAAGCTACSCDACTECVAVNLASNSSSLLTCPGRHGLALTRTSVPGYVCDFCGGDVATGVSIFSCRSVLHFC